MITYRAVSIPFWRQYLCLCIHLCYAKEQVQLNIFKKSDSIHFRYAKQEHIYLQASFSSENASVIVLQYLNINPFTQIFCKKNVANSLILLFFFYFFCAVLQVCRIDVPVNFDNGSVYIKTVKL